MVRRTAKSKQSPEGSDDSFSSTNIEMHRNNDDPVRFKSPFYRDPFSNGVNVNQQRSQCIQVIKSKLFISFVIISAMLLILLCIGLVVMYDKELGTFSNVQNMTEPWQGKISIEQEQWYSLAMKELQESLNLQWNQRIARNVILFVGDGMGLNTVTASRIHKYEEGGHLSWEEFPYMGLLKTYCTDRQVPDSTSTATALFGGVKANYHTSGVDSSVKESDCLASLNKSTHVESIIKWAQDAGMSTGFVTTTRVMHATPAALYSHCPNRKWECEATMPEEARQQGCKDIARQLVENIPGKNINVIMGGGRQCMVSNVKSNKADPIDTYACNSLDGRDLIMDWKMDKMTRNLRYSVIQNNAELEKLNPTNTDYVLGIFANGHLRYDHELDKGPGGMPTLKQMTEKALAILSKNRNKGFLLVVEGGMIDQAHHRGWAKRAILETAAMDEAVKSTLKIMKSQMDQTLVIVTSDHSHTLSINGYPKKGTDIFGVAQSSKSDGIPYTTLTYATGHFGYQVEQDVDGRLHRKDPTKENISAFDYVQQVGIYTDENTHGGSDVAVYANGPWAHLFHKLHEQSYVAHVISFAARIGQFRNNNWFDTFQKSRNVGCEN